MKKLIVLVVLIMCATVVFAQTNAVSLDVYPAIVGIDQSGNGLLRVNVGAGFEHAMSRNLSIGADLDFYLSSWTNYSQVFFGLIGKGRYYPASQALEGFFLGAGTGVGFSKVTNVDSKLNLIIEIEAGYKIMFSSLFVEPSIAYSYGRMWGSWKPGLRAGFCF